MPRVEAPPIDPRTYGDLVAEVEELMQAYTAGYIERSPELPTGVIVDEPAELPGGELPGGETIELPDLPAETSDEPADPGEVMAPIPAELIADTDELGPIRVRGWQRPAPGQEDAGWALARIFGRMAELVVTRLNRLPDRNFLAFLDLIGTRLNPPQPARVPLTFLLAAGSPVDALVPAGTQAAALALEGEAEPALFETERDLVVTRSQLVAVCTREPGRDLWADHANAGSFSPFRGDRRIEHRLHVTEPALFALPEAKTLDLRITPVDAGQPWLSAVTWSFWNGVTHQPVTPASVTNLGTSWRVRFENVPGIVPSAVNGFQGPWLQGRLETGLPRGERGEVVQVGQEREMRRRGARPAAAFVQTSGGVSVPVDLDAPFFPFGEEAPAGVFHLCAGTDFAKPKSTVEIEIALDAAHPPASTSDLAVTWEYWSGGSNGTWKALNGVVPSPATADRLLAGGTLRFPRPDDWTADLVSGVSEYWLRARVTAGSYGIPPGYRPPRVE
ncbi:MAG TPA: hypothetical protein VF414_00895, partial [Thermoanaerobaculia bacterium]